MANRYENKVRILDLIRELGEVSRPLLAEVLDINLPTISHLTKELLDTRLICGNGFEKSVGGRRAERLILNPQFATALGLELSLTGIRGVLADLGGHILDRHEGGSPVPGTPDEIVGAVLAVAEALLAKAPASRKPVGVGLSVAGLTDESGRVSRKFPHRENWSDVPLAQLLERRLGLPALLENDVQAATLAERRHGAARGAENMLYLHIGHGIACGIVVGGRLYTGATRNAGEFGHTIVEPQGPICYCGNYGCLESLASPSAILDRALQAIRKGVQSTVASASSGNLRAVSAESIFLAAGQGDRLASNVVTQAAEYIGLGLANLVNFFNPETVVFGGAVLARGHKVFNEAIERTFRSRVLPILQHQTRIVPSALGKDAAAVGGSMLIFEDLFDRPERLFGLANGKPLEVPPAERGSSAKTREARAANKEVQEKRPEQKKRGERSSRWRRWAASRPAAKAK